jgi:GTP cyclohydrolase II
LALEFINKIKKGLVIYLPQEGRGIGLSNKIRAYALQQEEGLDTVQANLQLGFDVDLRDFSCVKPILDYFQIESVILNSNNPDKFTALKKNGVHVSRREPSLVPYNDHNHSYLKTKMNVLGHQLVMSKDKFSK